MLIKEYTFGPKIAQAIIMPKNIGTNLAWAKIMPISIHLYSNILIFEYTNMLICLYYYIRILESGGGGGVYK